MDPIKDMFDKAAQSWDTPVRVSRAKAVSEEIKRVCDLTEMHKIEQAMEFGCGTGLVGLFLQNFIQHLTLMDNSSGMIQTLNGKLESLLEHETYKNHAVKSVKAVCADLLNKEALEDILEQHRGQNLIFSSMALHHIRPIDQLLGTFRELLNEEGILCLVDLNVDDEGAFHKNEKEFLGHHGFLQEDLAERMTLLGFSNVKYYTFYEDIKEKDGEKIPYSLFIMWGRK